MLKTILDEFKKAPYLLAVFFFLGLGEFVYVNYKQVTNHLPTKMKKLDEKIDKNQKELNQKTAKLIFYFIDGDKEKLKKIKIKAR